MGRGRNISGAAGVLLLLAAAAAAYEMGLRAPGADERADKGRPVGHIAADALEQPPDRSQRNSSEMSGVVPDVFCYDGHQLPSLFVIGTPKCGTTSVWKELASNWDFRAIVPHCQKQHPNAGSTYPCGGLPDEHPRYSSAKEKTFFDVPERVSRGLSHYAKSFPPCDPARPTFDGTPDYLASPTALDALVELYGPERIARSTFAVLLCDPVQR